MLFILIPTVYGDTSNSINGIIECYSDTLETGDWTYVARGGYTSNTTQYNNPQTGSSSIYIIGTLAILMLSLTIWNVKKYSDIIKENNTI